MKRFLLIVILFAIYAFLPLSSNAKSEINYDEVYNRLPAINIFYENNEDPDELSDYERYVKSPYPLLRTSLILTCKNAKLTQGYYLLVQEPEKYRIYHV
ncbi:MAG: hypothetical protein MZU97_06245 [Bacillus subtilis]|nr:hypothetical protein [Bacillus subtilis]